MRKTNTDLFILTTIILILAIVVSITNTYKVNNLQVASVITPKASVSQSLNGVIPTGTTDYGETLGIKYSDVSPNDARLADATINKMANIDRTVELTDADLERYINILYKMENGMSCEYCCGARSIIFENGQPACGCAHSFAMRGLTKYLITNSDYTDTQILEEIGKWKTLFFPTQMQAKAQILESNGIEFNYINLASNKYRGIEKGSAGSGMVGGC